MVQSLFSGVRHYGVPLFPFLLHFAFLSFYFLTNILPSRPLSSTSLTSKEDIFSRRFQIVSPLLRVPSSPSAFTPLLHFLPPLLSQPQAPNVESFTLLAAIAPLALPPAASLLHCYKIHCISTPTPLIQPRSHGRSPQIHPHYLPPHPPAARGNGLLPSPPQRIAPGPRRRRRRLPQQGGDVAAADAGVRRRRRRVYDGQPNRRLLALRGHGLAAGPAAAGRLRHRVRPQRAGRQRGPLVRGDGLLGPRPREPVPWHAPPRRDPGRSPLDRLRRRHDHPAQRGAPGQLLQDHRRAWRQRPRRGRWRLHHAAVRVQRHHPQHPRARLRPGGGRQRPVVADAQRVADPVGRRRHLALLGPGRVGRPLRAVPVRGRAGGRHHGVHGHHRLQLLLLAPQRGDAAGPQRRVPAGLRDAGHHRVQPLRGPARAADATVPPRLLPHRQQRLHRLGDVRHRRQRQPHHQLPGQPLHRPHQPQCQGGDEAGGHGGRAVERVELADGGGHDGERRLLRALGRRHGGHLPEGLQHRPQVLRARRPAHHRRRRPRRPQGQRGGGGVRRGQLRRSEHRRWCLWRRRQRIWRSRNGLCQRRRLDQLPISLDTIIGLSAGLCSNMLAPIVRPSQDVT